MHAFSKMESEGNVTKSNWLTIQITMPTCWKVERVLRNQKSIPFIVIILTAVLTSRWYFNCCWPGSLWMTLSLKEHQPVLPRLCTQGILDGVQYISEQRGRGFLSARHRQPTCRLHHYKLEDTVSCLDRLSASKNNDHPVHSSLALAKNDGRRNKFHIAFVGDSRVRILYLSFIKVKLYNFLSKIISIVAAHLQ